MYRVFLAIRYLRSRLVNLISIGGVMAGVAVLIVVVSIMDGFQEQVRKVVRGSLSHLILTPTVEPEALPAIKVLEAGLRRDVPDVQAVAPQIRFPVFHEYESRKRSVAQLDGMSLHQMEAIGIDYRLEREVSDIDAYLIAVHDRTNPFFHPEALEFEKTTCLVSRTFAENFLLGVYDAEGKVVHRFGALRDDKTGEPIRDERLLRLRASELIGQQVRIVYGTQSRKNGQRTFEPNSKNLLISGVYDSGDAVEDNQRIYLEIGEIAKMGSIRHAYLQVNVRLRDYELAADVKNTLTAILGDTFVVETWEDQKASFLAAVDQEKVMLVIVLSFIVLLGGFIILATLTLTVVEKTRDIGIVAALGAGRTGILSIFLWNGLLIGVLGALLGLGLGAWFTANVDGVHAFIKQMTGRDVFPPNIYHFRSIPTVWNWPTVISIMTGSVLVAFVAGLLPSLRASRLDPIAALRYE